MLNIGNYITVFNIYTYIYIFRIEPKKSPKGISQGKNNNG